MKSLKVMRKQPLNMTEDPVTGAILRFSIPILIGNIFQQFYNVVDTMVIGNVLGDGALAAVGAAGPIFGMVIGFASGITSGFGVVLAKYFGGKDKRQMEKTVAWTYVLTVAITFLLTAASLCFLHPLLLMLSTPKEILSETEQYMRIILGFSIVTMLYDMFSGNMRAIGNSRTPLCFLIISSVINVVLDILFVHFFGWGIGGAAYATVLSQFLSVILCMIYIRKDCPALRFRTEALERDTVLVKELLSMGFSMGLMYVVVSIGSVALQGAVNSLGSATVAAHTAARKIDDIFMLPLGTLSMAASTFAGQNLGAKKMDRVFQGMRNAILIAVCWSIFSMACIWLFGTPMIRMISGTKNPEIIRNANRYIRINVSFFALLSVLLVLRSSLQGLGRKGVPVMGSVVELVFKFAAVGFITGAFGYFGVCILEPVIWCVCAVMVFIDFLLCRKQLLKSAGHGASDIRAVSVRSAS